MSIYRVLKGEHKEVSILINTIETLPETETGRKQLYQKLRNELLSHAEAEKETVYAALEASGKADGVIGEAKVEHEEIKVLLGVLDQTDPATHDWTEKFSALKEEVESHIAEEETLMFDRMHQAFAEEEAQNLGKIFQERKQEILTTLKTE